MTFYPLSIIEKLDATPSSCYITFKIPKKLRSSYKYKAGQYVNIRIKDNNNIYQNRCYSICGPIDSSNISICTKKVPGGLLSNYLCNDVKIGDELSVSIPAGDFTLVDSNKDTENIVFISAGSGITPIKSQIDLLLKHKHKKNIFLIYGNNSKEEVIFYDYFKKIEKEHSNFKLVLILKETSLEWNGEQGRLITETLSNLFETYNIPLVNGNYYISGPFGMIASAETFLYNKGIDKSNIFKENFFTEAPTNAKTNETFKVEINANGEKKIIDVKGNETILNATLNAGFNVNHSCKTGNCLNCVAKLSSGEIVVQNDSELTEEQKQNKIIVTCQSFVTCNNTSINYDVEIDQGFLKNRNKILLAGFILFMMGAFFLFKPETNTFLAKGNMNIGHEELQCAQCHKDAPGTARQQIQRNFKHLIGGNVKKADFGTKPVDNDACISCHNRPNDNHPVHRFNEPKFKDAREAIHPETCTSCHNEHHGERVTFKDTDYCKNCHKDVKITNDPLDLKHSKLIELELWNTCIQCHDFHGNHIMKVAKSIKDTIPLKMVKDYLNTGKDPYGNIKKYIVDLDSINNKTLK